MGNCFSCFKIPPPSDSTANSPVGKDKEETGGASAGAEPSPPLTAVAPQANGGQRCPSAFDASAAPDACASGDDGPSPAPPPPPAPAVAFPAARCGRGWLGGGRSSEGGGGCGGGIEGKLSVLFEGYRDAREDAILADGIERLCSDLVVSPDDFKVLVLAWKMDAARMCRFSRAEFIGGMRSLRCDSIRSLQARLPEAVVEVVREPDLFKELYRFTFRFGLDAEVGQRALPTDMAVILWRLVFSQREPPILSRWLYFLEAHPHVRGIPRDTWNMFLNFAEAVGSDLSAYDDTEAWPSLFDDFVEYENDKANQNVADKTPGPEEVLPHMDTIVADE